MENIILSDEEIIKAVEKEDNIDLGSNFDINSIYNISEVKAVARESQRKLLRILKERCRGHGLGLTFTGYFFKHRYLCSECLDEIEKEINK